MALKVLLIFFLLPWLNFLIILAVQLIFQNLMLFGLVLKRVSKFLFFWSGFHLENKSFSNIRYSFFLLKLGPCLIIIIRLSWSKLKVSWIVGIQETFPWLARFVLLKLFCCHNIYFQFCVLKSQNSFIKCFSNLFGMGEKNRVNRTCICNKYNNCVVSVWLTLIISPKNKKWHGSN